MDELNRLNEQKQQTQSALPTEKEVRSKQRAMDDEVLQSLPEWRQRTSHNSARFQVLGDRHEANKQTPEYLAMQKAALIADPVKRAEALRAIAAKAKAEVLGERAELTAGKGGVGSDEPKRSLAQWTQEYDVKRNSDKSVSYNRDNQERFVDHGKGVSIKSNDDRSIKDAVSLAREKWGERITVNTQDTEKREAIMRAMAQQGVKLANKDEAMQHRYAEITKQVESERLRAELSRPQRVEQSATQAQSQHISA